MLYNIFFKGIMSHLALNLLNITQIHQSLFILQMLIRNKYEYTVCCDGFLLLHFDTADEVNTAVCYERITGSTGLFVTL